MAGKGAGTKQKMVWAIIDVSRGIKSRGLLQDAVFVGQELGLLPQKFKFPIWPGIGTARYSRQLDHALSSLIRTGHVYDTGGPQTLKAVQRAPLHLRTEVIPLWDAIRTIGESRLSLMAAYLMAKCKERKDGVHRGDALRSAARDRLGWPTAMTRNLEAELARLKKKKGKADFETENHLS